MSGDNAPEFLRRQLDFAAHIRDPEAHPAPADVDPARMRVYADLVFNNLEGLLAQCFPVARRVLEEDLWRALVREFLRRHGSATPLFPEIAQEFLAYLVTRGLDRLPPFLLELCHYEWVELDLSLASEELPALPVDVPDAILSDTSRVVLSPVSHRLQYQFPVHRIGPGWQPTEPDASSTLLLVWRRRDDRIRFMELNARSLMLLNRLVAPVEVGVALRELARELPEESAHTVYESGLETLERLRKAEAIIGADPAQGESR